MTTLEDAKKRGPERHLTNAYNFAGPGTMYKARMKGSDFYENLMKEAGRKLVGTKPYNVPINKLDTCARTHDKTYADPKATADEVRKADNVFIDCIGKVKVSDGIEEKLLAVAGKVGFDTKRVVEDAGLVRKGSFSDGGDKQSGLGKKISKFKSMGKKVKQVIKKGVKFN